MTSTRLRWGTVATTTGVATLAAQWLPAVSSVAPLRRSCFPRLAGVSDRHHVALTFDDGPDRASTPRFLRLLAERGTSATFFLLGEHAVRERSLVREMTDAGHELGVHGWSHECVATIGPRRMRSELDRARGTVEDLTGDRVRWYRPPYGVLTGTTLVAVRAVGLQPVLWSSWGVDWSARATPRSIGRRVLSRARPGGTVLLHDSDRTSAPGSWRACLAAVGDLLDGWSAAGVPVGPLREHW